MGAVNNAEHLEHCFARTFFVLRLRLLAGWPSSPQQQKQSYNFALVGQHLLAVLRQQMECSLRFPRIA